MSTGIQLFNLTGKVALVTGASHGLGMAMALALGQAGARVIINGRSALKLADAKAIYAKQGVQVETAAFDVTQSTEIEQAIDQIEQQVASIDILVNNAGIIKRIPALEMTEQEFAEVVHTDLTAPFLMAQAVARRMIPRGGGKIINICSMMSEVARNTVSAYASAKGGLKMLTKSLATEWAKHHIQVNGIGPGYFATEQTAPIRHEGHPFNDFIIARTPAGRWGEPQDLAGAVIFLASSASNFVNGQILYVDGGILATLGKGAHE